MTPRFFQVGGCVRDTLLGLKPKDIDFAVEADSYNAMRDAVAERCGGYNQIKVEHPEHVTLRAVDPKLGGVDFVLCRKDGTYSDGRRPDFIEVGTLADDLARRDFTMNAIALADDGSFIDPFNGQHDIERRIIKCVGDPHKRFSEDKLRLLRAFRFSITKEFSIVPSVGDCMNNEKMVDRLRGVSVERIREELLKCFAFNTAGTLRAFSEFPLLFSACFESENGLRLEPTLKK